MRGDEVVFREHEHLDAGRIALRDGELDEHARKVYTRYIPFSQRPW